MVPARWRGRATSTPLIRSATQIRNRSCSSPPKAGNVRSATCRRTVLPAAWEPRGSPKGADVRPLAPAGNILPEWVYTAVHRRNDHDDRREACRRGVQPRFRHMASIFPKRARLRPLHDPSPSRRRYRRLRRPLPDAGRRRL